MYTLLRERKREREKDLLVRLRILSPSHHRPKYRKIVFRSVSCESGEERERQRKRNRKREKRKRKRGNGNVRFIVRFNQEKSTVNMLHASHSLISFSLSPFLFSFFLISFSLLSSLVMLPNVIFLFLHLHLFTHE